MSKAVVEEEQGLLYMLIDHPHRPAIFFLPETGFYPYSRGLAVLGDALRTQGRQILFTRCSGQLTHCSMLVGHQVSLADAELVRPRYCAECRRIFNSAMARYGFGQIDFTELVTDGLHEALKEIKEMDVQALMNFSFSGFPLAQMAQYDFSLESKAVFSPGMDGHHTQLYRAHVANTYAAAFFAREIVNKFNPHSLATFNQYAQCHLVRHIAQNHGVLYQSLTYPVHFGIDASLFSLTRQEYCYVNSEHCQRWAAVRDIPAPEKKAFECWQDAVFRENARGSHIYSLSRGSGPDAVFTRLGLNPNRRLIVAYTSSYDEIFGVEIAMNIWREKLPEKNVFTSQIEWLKDLRNWAASRGDVQVVVRIHPREGKNKNYAFASQHLMELEAVFKENTGNFITVWPEDPISSYDLLELAHACVVPWTSMGMEAARLGVPVLSWAGNMYYADDDFIQVATEHGDYRTRLDGLVSGEYSWNTLTRAVRYYHWRTFIPCLELRETVPVHYDDDTVWPAAPHKLYKDISEIFEGRQDLVEYNKEKWLRALPPDAPERERQANLKGVRLFVDSLFTAKQAEPQKPDLLFRVCRKLCRLLLGRTPSFFAVKKVPTTKLSFVDYQLEFCENFDALQACVTRTAGNPGLHILVAEDAWHLWLVREGKANRRMSPLLLRLGRAMARSAASAS